MLNCPFSVVDLTIVLPSREYTRNEDRIVLLVRSNLGIGSLRLSEFYRMTSILDYVQYNLVNGKKKLMYRNL